MAINLVLIPMEGVSQTLFWQYRECMPVLWDLSNRSLMFRRFYSASTSAFQSFCDVVHGDSSELDHNLAYPSAPGCILGRTRNLFSILHEKGYATLGIQHGESMPGYLKDNVLGAWPKECGEFRWHGSYDGFYAESGRFIEDAAKSGKPFALFYCDKASTMGDNCEEKRESPLFHERIEKGLSLLDRSVGAVMEKLAALSLIDSTVVVIYGAYGMDAWKHGVSVGRTHAIEPYADLAWTPMFMYSNDRNIEIVEFVASSIDIKATLLGILLPDENFNEIVTDFTGINLFAVGRSVAFTQNLFALERENEGPARGLVKSYAATDGEQRLIISSDGGIPGEGGMELYYDMRDPGNTRNLLDFFKLNADGVMTMFGLPNIIHPHFTQSFKPHLVRTVVDSYNQMREILKLLVSRKESEAMRHCSNPKDSLPFRESRFNVKRPRRR